MKKITFIFILFSFFAVSQSAAAQQIVPFEHTKGISAFASDDVKTTSLLLSGYHKLAPKDAFLNISNVENILIALAVNDKSFYRERAIIALARYWPSSDLFLLMASIIAEPHTAFSTRIKLMVQFGMTFNKRAVPILSLYLKSTDPQIRISALQALQATNAVDAFKRINAHHKTEKNERVQEAILRYRRYLR